MNEIEGLIERLEKATGPDRELDDLIAVRVAGMKATTTYGHELLGNLREAPNRSPACTASLDAALALVERVRPGAWYRLGCGRNHPDEPLYGAQILLPDVPAEEDGAVLGEGEHNDSLALAILLALLRTLETQNG